MSTELAEVNPTDQRVLGRFDACSSVGISVHDELEICRLNESQKQALTELLGEFGARYYQNLPMEDRGVFVDKLAGEYTMLPLKGLSVEAKRVRGDYLCAFLLGMEVDEIATEFDDTTQRVSSCIDKATKTITKNIGSDRLQHLLTDRQSSLQELEEAARADISDKKFEAGDKPSRKTLENSAETFIKVEMDKGGDVEKEPLEKTNYPTDTGAAEEAAPETEVGDGDGAEWDTPHPVDTSLGVIEYGTSESNYFSRITNHTLLEPAEEIKLAKRIEQGDLKAKQKLIEHNYRLVAKIAGGYVREGSSLKFGDLFNEGVIGLIRAAEKFDHRKGYRFTTYATWWIRQAIQRSYQDKEATIRIPVHIHERSRKVRGAEELIELEHGDITGMEAEIASIAGITIDDLELLRKAFKPVDSLDRALNPGEPSSTSLGDLTASKGPSTENQVLQTELEDEVGRAINILPDNYALIIRTEFGIGAEPTTKNALAETLGVSRNTVSKWLEEAMEMLRDIMRENKHLEILDPAPSQPTNSPKPASSEAMPSEKETKHQGPGVLAILNSREREVLSLIDRGNCEIAHALGINESTVRTHFCSIRGKLGIETQAQLRIFAQSYDTTGISMQDDEAIKMLTPREHELLTKHYDHTYKEAASSMKLSTSTIRSHWHNIFIKLGVGNKLGAAAIGFSHGLINPQEETTFNQATVIQ